MRDAVDDEIEAALKGHFDAEGLAKDANEAVDAVELPKPGEMRMPEMDIRPESERVMQMPEMDLRPEADGPRPGSIKAQVGAALTGGAQPAPSKPAPTRDTEIEDLQADAKKRRDFSQLGQAVTDFTERPTNLLDYAQRLGGGGVSPAPKSKMWQESAAEGDRAIEDLAARRKSEAGMETQQATRAASADDNDANGQTAQTYRSVLVKFAPELSEKLATATPKQMRAIAPWLEKFATENNDLLQAKAAAEAKAAQQAKADAEKKTALDLAQKNRAEDVADRRANTAATQSLANASFGLRKGEIETKHVENIESDVQKLSKELPGDEADFNRKAAEIRADIAASPDDIEGVGLIDSNRPAWLQTERGLRIQKNAGQMQAAWKKLITGTGGGAAEMANLDKIGIQLGNERSFLAGLDALEKGYAEKVKSVRAGYRPEVVKTLDERRGREGMGASGTVEITDKKGGKYSVPAAEAEALKAELRAEGLL